MKDVSAYYLDTTEDGSNRYVICMGLRKLNVIVSGPEEMKELKEGHVSASVVNPDFSREAPNDDHMKLVVDLFGLERYSESVIKRSDGKTRHLFGPVDVIESGGIR